MNYEKKNIKQNTIYSYMLSWKTFPPLSKLVHWLGPINCIAVMFACFVTVESQSKET